MSVKSIGKVWEMDLGAPTKIVLLAMADHADHTGGNIYPRKSLIAKKCGYTKRHIISVIQELMDQEILAVQRTLESGIKVYKIQFQNAQYQDFQEPIDDEEGGEQISRGGVNRFHGGGEQISPGGVNRFHPEPKRKENLKETNPKKGELASSDAAPLGTGEDGKSDDLQNGSTKAEQELVDLWNALPEPFPKIRRMNGPRKKTLRARLKDPEWRKDFKEALERVPRAKFLAGHNDRGWVADIEFFLRPGTVDKILEGKYDETTPPRPRKNGRRGLPAPSEVDWSNGF